MHQTHAWNYTQVRDEQAVDAVYPLVLRKCKFVFNLKAGGFDSFVGVVSLDIQIDFFSYRFKQASCQYFSETLECTKLLVIELI